MGNTCNTRMRSNWRLGVFKNHSNRKDLLPTGRAWGGTRTEAFGPILICSALEGRYHLKWQHLEGQHFIELSGSMNRQITQFPTDKESECMKYWTENRTLNWKNQVGAELSMYWWNIDKFPKNWLRNQKLLWSLTLDSVLLNTTSPPSFRQRWVGT